jgi:hypothetical protein
MSNTYEEWMNNTVFNENIINKRPQSIRLIKTKKRFLCLIQVQLGVHDSLYFFLDNLSSTCFGCYLHPSSGARLQRTAIGFLFVETEVLLSNVVEVF